MYVRYVSSAICILMTSYALALHFPKRQLSKDFDERIRILKAKCNVLIRVDFAVSERRFGEKGIHDLPPLFL